MSSQNSNPFVLPGFGQVGDLSQNPLLSSLEMMSQAWQGLAGSGVLAQPPVSAGFTTDELDRRINDLRAVENWLRVNMSMLSSSIQALEVQRATIATLKSFANVPGAPADAADNPSPLEVALGIKPSGQAKIKTPEQVRENVAAPEAPEGAASSAGASPATPSHTDPAVLADAAQGWWDMLQKQFDTLASAAMVGMQAAQPQDAAGSAAKKAAPRKAPARRTSATATEKPRAAAKTTATAKRTPAKKAAAKSPRKRSIGQGRTS